MRPILFAEDETNFNHNGIGVLDEALTSEVTEVTNGEFEVIIDYPVSGRWFKEIKNMMIVRVKPNAKDDDHNFRIYDIDKTTSTKTITIYAHSITNDIGGNLVKSVKVDNKTAQEALNLLKNSLVEKTDITFQSDITTKSSTEWTMQNPLNAIVGSEGSMVQYWGGEIKRTDRILYLMSRRGTDRVTTIRPQKGMTGLTMKTSTKGIITRILPYFVLRDEEKDTEQTIVGTIVASPLAGNYPIDNLVPVDYGQDDEINTLAKLNAAAKTYFTTQNPGCDKPDVEINVDLLQLADTPFYSKFKNMEAIGLTDTIIVYVPKYDVDVEVKVNELVYNSLAEKTTSITAGDVSGTFYESSKKDYDKTISALQQYVTKSQNGLRNYVQISANGKNKVYRGYTEPDISLAIEGDLWFKEIGNGEQEIWIFDGAYWQPLMTAGINAETQAALDLAQQEIDLAKEDLKAVDAAMATVDAAMADLKVEMDNTKIATADAKKAADDAQIAADDASAVGKAAQEAGDQALSLVDQAQKDINSANEIIGAHTIDLSNLFADFANMDTVVDAIVIDTGTMKTAISENEAAIKAVKTTTDQAIADNAADILTAQQLAESAKSKADAVEATTHTITEDLDGITETITTIESTATSTTKTLNEVKSTVDGQVQTIATVKSTADSALSKSNTNSTTIDGIQTTLTETKTTATSALTKANAAQSTADGNTSKITSVTTTANSALSKANTAQSTADGNTSKITSVTTTANSALSKANTLEETVDGVTRTLSSVESTVSNIGSQGTNLLINGGFENDFFGWKGDSVHKIDTVDTHSGTKALMIDAYGSIKMLNLNVKIPVYQGQQLEFSMWYKTSSDFNGTSGNNKLRVGKQDGSLLSGYGWDGAVTEWTNRVVTLTVGSGISELTIRIDSIHSVGKVWWDDISITDVTNRNQTNSKVNQISDTVDGHTQLIASTKSTADSALTKANSAQSTADGNTSKITAVTTTANNALSKANTVSETVDGVTRTITSVQEDLNNIGGRNLLIRFNDQVNTALAGSGSDPGSTTVVYPNPIALAGFSTMREAIKVTPGSAYTFTKSGGGYWRYNWLDVDYNFISRFTPTSRQFTVTAPMNAEYLWASYPTNEDVKIEKGPISTGFSLAPEDQATTVKINTISDTVDDHTQLIASTTTTANSALSKANSAQSTADGNTTKITATTTTANTALSTANTAKSTADGNSTKITSVTTTANSALSKANTAQSTADGNTTKITSVTTTADNALAKATSVETTANGIKTTVSSLTTEVSKKATDNHIRTSSTGVSGGGSWTKFANVRLTGQYQDTGFGTDVMFGSDGGSNSRPATVYIRAKQQSVMGSPVLIDIALTETDTLTTEMFAAIVTELTTSVTNIDFYVKIPNNYTSLSMNPFNELDSGKLTYYSSQPLLTTLPTSKQTVVYGTARGNLAGVNGAVSQITQLADQIDLRVQKNGVINAINVSTEGVVIAGNKITITGTTTISSGVIKTAHIADANISTAKIADLAVANGKIANLAVTEGKIGDLAVTNAKIGNLAVNSGKIEDASIITAKIGDLAVSEAKIANLAVTNAKIGNLAVTGAKIADATITSAKIVSLDAGKVTANTLSAITANTGTLNVSGWLTMTSDNVGVKGSYNVGDRWDESYNPRWFQGEYTLGRRFIKFLSNVYWLNDDDTKGEFRHYAETYFGGDYFKMRAYPKANTASNLIGRIDITAANGIEMSDNWSNVSPKITLNPNGDAAFTTVYSPNLVTTGRINPYMSWTTFQLNENEINGMPRLALTSGPRFGIESSVKKVAQFSVGTDGSQNGRVWFPNGVYDRTYGSAANMVITDAGTIGRSTSASKYKLSISEIPDAEDLGYKLLTVSPKMWFDKNETELTAEEISSGESKSGDHLLLREHYGLIAEDLRAAGLDNYVSINQTTGEIEGIEYDRLWTTLIPVIKGLVEEKVMNGLRIDKLERQMEALLNG